MKYIALFFAVVFLLFAYWQLNDPDDRIWWIAMYLLVAYISVQVFMGKYNLELLTILCAIYAISAINIWTQMTAYEGFFTDGAGMDMKTVNQELVREAAGLGICFGVLLLYLVAGWIEKNRLRVI
ncbi:MAG: transmembrane 220 family protein [Verrucomicrobia bacterium]|nr:transmembrane 220 family protein [Cytophagales bacterium]